jgi:competence protein ComEC
MILSASEKTSRHPLVWLACAFAAGIVVASYTILVPGPILGLSTAFAVAALLSGRRTASAYLLIASFALLGAFCYQFEIASLPDHRIKRIYDEGRIGFGTPLEIEGLLSGRPEPAYDGAFIRLRAEALIRDMERIPASGTVRMFIPLSETEQLADLAALELSSGTRIRTACELMREDQFLNPGVTPRRTLLDQQGIDATCTVKSPLLIEVLGRPIIAGPLDVVYGQRQWVIDEFRSRLSPQAAGVMIASLLGDKHFLDRETADVFRDGGTFHVLVISGLHITFIGGILLWLVCRVTRDRWWQLAAAGTALWFYTFAVGAEVPVVRASVMFSAFLFSRAIYRNGSLLNTLGLCTLILLAWRPADLFNPSFQLTVVSVAAIVGMAFPLIERLRFIGSWMPEAATPFPPNVPLWLRRACETLYWRPHVWEIEQGRQIWSARIFKSPFFADRIADGARKVIAYLFEGVVVSFIVQLWMLPLMIYYFHRVSPVSVILNLWVGLVIAVESFTAVFAVLLGQISDPLALPFAAATNALNWLLVSFPRVFTDLGWASFRVPVYSGPVRLIYFLHYVPLIAVSIAVCRWDVFALVRRRGPAYYSAAASIALVGVIASAIAFHPWSEPGPDGRFRVEFLDVGQGDSAFITFPDGQTMLIDGGGRVSFTDNGDEDRPFEPDSPRIGEMVVSEFLWEKGLSRVDRLVVTHADADHAQGLADVVRNFEVGEIWLGAMPKGGSELDELLSEAKRYSVQVKQIGRGDTFDIAGAGIETLWPARSAEQAGSDNNASLVLRLVYGESEFLFTGDIEKETEAALLSSGSVLSADVIKVPHHGSRTSSTAEFVTAVRPRITIIPVGRRSMFGHPHPEVLQRWQSTGSTILITGHTGTITLTTDGRTMRLETFLK